MNTIRSLYTKTFSVPQNPVPVPLIENLKLNLISFTKKHNDNNLITLIRRIGGAKPVNSVKR